MISRLSPMDEETGRVGANVPAPDPFPAGTGRVGASHEVGWYPVRPCAGCGLDYSTDRMTVMFGIGWSCDACTDLMRMQECDE